MDQRKEHYGRTGGTYFVSHGDTSAAYTNGNAAPAGNAATQWTQAEGMQLKVDGRELVPTS